MNDSDEETIRCLVKVKKDSHPELFEELKSIHPRGRSERLRTTSTAFLRLANSNVFNGGGAPPDRIEEDYSEKELKDKSERDSMISMIGGSF